VLAGFSASALHGARWIDPGRPATVIDTNRRRTRGLRVWADGIEPDEICQVDGMRVTTAVRTAVDLARHYPVDTAVAAVDALARAARLSVDDLLAATNRPGRHGMSRARTALALVDPGAESPKETWLRLVIIRAGFPRPETQVPVYNEYGVLIGVVDLGWRDRRFAVEYEGKHHRLTSSRFDKDISRIDEIIEQGWTVLRITAADTEATVVRRLRLAWDRRAAA
jgi:very-short-patch-repair endonuclease